MHTAKTHHVSQTALKNLINVARGNKQADLVIKNGRFLDAFNGRFVAGDIAVYKGIIVGINETYEAAQTIDAKDGYIVPGFIDTHVHIESSMMVPAQYQRAVLPRGTTTVIWDPHEIANVKGTTGIKWALQASENLLLDVFIMLSSCVPSTSPELDFETSGGVLTAAELYQFRHHPRVLGLAEMMNFPGLLAGEQDVLEKIILFQDAKIDGHCPLLTGKDLNAYIVAKIHTTHEATTLIEAREALSKGMHILIREGSCAKNSTALLPILDAYTSATIALCSDDRNPADLFYEGHIDYIVNKALTMGHAPVDIFRAASFAAANMYGLEDRGAIAPGYIADLCLIQPKQANWQNGMELQAVYKRGELVTEQQQAQQSSIIAKPIFVEKNLNVKLSQQHTQNRHPAPDAGSSRDVRSYVSKEIDSAVKPRNDEGQQQLSVEDLQVTSRSADCQQVNVIGIKPEQIITEKLVASLPVVEHRVQADLAQDILKIAVFERHHATGNHTVGFVKGFGLKQGAIASSINHDTHNIIVVGADDTAMVTAVNALLRIDGGIVVADANNSTLNLPLTIGGLMSDDTLETVIKIIKQQKQLLHDLGCKLAEPFLQLAFLALPVIPALKITDRGLIDVEQFAKIDVLQA